MVLPMKRSTLTALLTCAALSGCELLPVSLSTPAPPRVTAASDAATRCGDHLRAVDKARIGVSAAQPASGSSSGSLGALYWCTEAAKQGDAKSQYALAGIYERGVGTAPNPTEAQRWYKTSARNGYAAAQFRVGRMYGLGAGVPQDRDEATRWYIKAANQGYPEAQYYMGYRYEHGKGITQNYIEARRWYVKAAEQGNVSALNGLGRLHLAGHGVPQNQVEAYKWFNLAAVSGEPEFIANRDALAGKLTPAQLAEGQRLASDWAKSHALGKAATR